MWIALADRNTLLTRALVLLSAGLFFFNLSTPTNAPINRCMLPRYIHLRSVNFTIPFIFLLFSSPQEQNRPHIYPLVDTCFYPFLFFVDFAVFSQTPLYRSSLLLFCGAFVPPCVSIHCRTVLLLWCKKINRNGGGAKCQGGSPGEDLGDRRRVRMLKINYFDKRAHAHPATHRAEYILLHKLASKLSSGTGQDADAEPF